MNEMNILEKVYKVVTVKHPNCNTPYTFMVPASVDLCIGEYVLCDTRANRLPQVAQCITPTFMITGTQLQYLYGISPSCLRPIVAVMTPHMVMKEYVEDGVRDGGKD